MAAEKKIEVGNGYVVAACEAVGVGRHVYFRAVKAHRNGEPLSKNQLDVLAKHAELINEAKEKQKLIG